METFYQGNNDVFLTKVRADFDAVENQAMKAISSLEQNGLLASTTKPNALFTDISDITDDGDRAVWRHISVAGSSPLGTRKAGTSFPQMVIKRGYETAVYDPDLQDAGEFAVPEERQDKEANKYQAVLNRAQQAIYKMRFKNIGDPFDVFNLAFTAPSDYPSAKFVARGNKGLDDNFTPLGERLISTQHVRADGGPTQSNAVQSSGNAAALSVTTYGAALEQAQTYKDDVGDPSPKLGGMKTLVVPPANGLVRIGKEIMGSEWKPGTANNEINAFKNDFNEIISSPYLSQSLNAPTITDTYKWFLVDTASMDPEVGTGLVRVCFIPLNSRVERDQFKQAILYQVKQEYSYAWVSWLSVTGSKGNNQPYSA